jgi:translation initiation factor 2B subunit (eIF-2B alpha/beta/delta family)
MNEKDRAILCSLIRDHEDMVGSSRAAMLALQAFINSIRELKCQPSEIRDQYLELSEAIKNTQPKIIPLIHLIEDFEKEMAPHFGGEMDVVRNKAIEILQSKHDLLKSKVGKIIQHGMNIIDDGDVIIVHTASTDVMNMLSMAKQVMDKKIKVIVLKQDVAKTKQLIAALQQAQVEIETVPEFSLSHYVGEANKLFLGALSLTHDKKIVSSVGTASIASLCHFHKVPVYLFANTLKFSHKPSEDQRIHEKKFSQEQESVCYELTTFSHDMLELAMVDFLVTEDGVFSRDAIDDYVARTCR